MYYYFKQNHLRVNGKCWVFFFNQIEFMGIGIYKVCYSRGAICAHMITYNLSISLTEEKDILSR